MMTCQKLAPIQLPRKAGRSAELAAELGIICKTVLESASLVPRVSTCGRVRGDLIEPGIRVVLSICGQVETSSGLY